MKYLLSSLIIFTVLSIYSCRSGSAKNDSFKPLFSTYKKENKNVPAAPEKNIIFYGVLSPVEICSIFNRLGVPYNSVALNPTTNKDLYLSSSKTALNAGIYGVDFGYLKMFGVGQEMINNIMTIRDMSYNLGIPDIILSIPIEKIQSNISDPDTIMAMVNTAYSKIDNHLRTQGRESTAGLILLGGWVEAMYISTQLVYDPANPDPEVVQRIAEQKYTLTSLMSLMKNYYDDPVVVYYSKKLKYLNRYFDSFEIFYKKGDLEIDVPNQLFRSTGSEMTITVETLNLIRDYVNKLRTEMVTP
jgi:hypothetical protein